MEVDQVTWTTPFTFVVYKNGDDFVAARNSIGSSSDGDIMSTIQVGKFRSTYNGSKLMVSLNDEEASWFAQNALKAAFSVWRDKSGETKTLFEFCGERRVTKISLGMYKKYKQVKLTQETPDGELIRGVSLTTHQARRLAKAVSKLIAINDMTVDSDVREEARSNIIDAFVHKLYANNFNEAQIVIDSVDGLNEMMSKSSLPAAHFRAAVFVAKLFAAGEGEKLLSILLKLGFEGELRLSYADVMTLMTTRGSDFFDNRSTKIASTDIVNFMIDCN